MQAITPESYHDDLRHISKSGIDIILKSPQHFYNRYYCSDKRKDSAAFAAGRALHVALSEPQKFQDLYIVAPGKIDGRTREGKQRIEAFDRAAQGKIVIPEMPLNKDAKSRVLSYEQVMRMRDAVFSHPIASMLMLAGEAEKVITWIDDITGAPCKAMLDWLPKAAGGNFVLDFKSTEDASEEGFAKSVRNFHYARQDAHYINGLAATTGLHYKMIFVVVEKHPPYSVELYALTPERRQEAQSDIQQALERYIECQTAYNKTGDAGVWYGYNKLKTVKLI